MATCENTNCGKTNLRKTDVELDQELGKIYCTGCYCMLHPGWTPTVEGEIVSELVPPPEVSYELSLSNRDGFRAKLGYGEVSIAFHAPMTDIKRALGQ